ncbi:putative histidine kinase HHK19p, partial [Aureobasidium melanogenum]
MTNIITDTLTLSKLDANLLRISPSTVRSVCMLQDIQKMFEVEAKRLGVNLSTIVDSSLAAQGAEWMTIDTGRVMQILINLGPKDVTVRVGASKTRPLDLPVDFTIARALQDSIYDTAEFSENTCYLWFTVEDTGIGMNSEEQNRIFSRFAQGSIRTHKTYGGSGLGLFISRTLSELQGGEIGVSSEPEKGSTFAFFVKAHTTSPPQVQENGNGVSRLPSPATHDLKPGKIPISVLIVEDNAVNQRVLQRSLKVKGYVTYVANHGQEALDFLRTTKLWKGNETSPTAPEIDVVLMDVEMPVMDGLECARNIRNYQRTGEMRSNLPIIAASANARAEQVQLALEAGMDDSITKPFRIPELTPKIDSFAAWARAQG